MVKSHDEAKMLIGEGGRMKVDSTIEYVTAYRSLKS